MTEEKRPRRRRQSEVTQDLKDTIDHLTELALLECDPSKWYGANQRPDQMTESAMNMRIKNKTNAVMTVNLIKNLHNVISQRENGQAKRLAFDPMTAGDLINTADKTRAMEDKAQEHIRNAVKTVRH